MATIKSYTNLEQSKKLAEILPLESADMCWFEGEPFVEAVTGYEEERAETHRQAGMEMYPCWSLAALTDIIENIDKLQKVEISFTHSSGKYWVNVHFDEFGSFCQDYELYDSKIDALIAMIEKFKNRNLL